MSERNPALKKNGLKHVLTRLQDYFAKKAETVFSVNRTQPENGDVTIRTVPFADNLTSDKTQASEGEFIIRTAGGDASISDGDAFAIRIMGNRVHTGYVAEQLEMTVIPMTRPEGEEPITAAIDRDTFVAYVDESGTTTLTYTTAWSADPTNYGITVTGTPVAGDQIVVVYVKEDRGTIIQATPTALKSTGWNLYDHAAGYAYVHKYSDQYGFRIGGTYTELAYAETPEGSTQAITPVDGAFTVPGDGYVIVTGGNATDTYIINVWSDWTEGPAGAFEAYSETAVSLAAIMTANFPNGLMRVGDVRDEIDLNSAQAISRIGRMAYSAANLASAKASGRPWEADTDYIYIVKAEETTAAITLNGSYTASDHGNEFFTGTAVAVYLETIYGNNLKNKLERDVLTISQQTLSAAQKSQVQDNIGVTAEIAALNSNIGSLDQAIGTLSSLKTPTKTNLVVAVNESYRVKETELASGTSWTLKIPTTPTGIHAHILTITSANGTIWGLYYINIPSGIDSVGTLTTIASGLGAPTVSAGANRTIAISVASARALYLSDLAMRGDFLTVA